jgi:hypothetical protein
VTLSEREPSRVLLSVPNGGSAGSVLRTGLVRRLLEAHPGVEIVLLSPLVRDPVFAGEFGDIRVHLDDLAPHVPAGLEARLGALMQAAYLTSDITESVRIRFAEARANRTMRWIRTKRWLTRVALRSMTRKGSRYAVSDRLISHPSTEALFDRVRPALYVASSPGLIFSEVPLLRTAARRGVRSMAVDPSWDNFTNKLLPVRHVDRLIVWNDVMKREAVELHGYAPDEVRVSGPPQWDIYFQPRPAVSRESFFSRIGADPKCRLVTLTTTPRSLYRHHDHVLGTLVAALASKAWHVPAQVLVRLHPRDDERAYAAFRGVPGVIIEKPFRRTVTAADGLDVDVTNENRQHLADTMQHSDVVINVASTIAIEAAIFDTPVVNVAFDGRTPSAFAVSARRYYRFTHYENITRHDAVRIANTPAELMAHVSRYLADPSLDREGRRRVVLEQCQFLDGRSSERVARFVADELADVMGGRKGNARNASTCAESLVSSR